MIVKQKMKRHAKCLGNTHANTMPHPIFMQLAQFFPGNFRAKSKPAKIAYRQELPRQKLPVSENFTPPLSILLTLKL